MRKTSAMPMISNAWFSFRLFCFLDIPRLRVVAFRKRIGVLSAADYPYSNEYYNLIAPCWSNSRKRKRRKRRIAG